MATKTKSRTNKSKSSFKFQWWMGLLIVGLIVVVGIVIVRLSQASGGWCDQYFASRSNVKKVACYFAVDDISDKDPNKVQTQARLVRFADPETGLSGPEGWYIDSSGMGAGGLIWGGPGKNFSGVKGKNVKACWWLRDMSGNARVNVVMKNNGSLIAQDNLTVSGSGYNPYCISQNLSTDLTNASFELRLLNGRVLANRQVVQSAANASSNSTLPTVK